MTCFRELPFILAPPPLAIVFCVLYTPTDVPADIRGELKEDKACLPAIRSLQSSADPMIAKHASIALETVLWEP